MTTKTAAALRKQNLTAAKRSLKLILAAAQRHLDQLEAGEIPGDTFAASAAKYEQSLVTLGTLDMLGEGSDGDNGEATIEVRADALEALVLFAHGFVTEAGRQPGSPIDELTRAVYPDGIVPAPAEQLS